MPHLTGIILAGGLSRRMGGIDKGLQLLRGKPMVQWVIERLAPQVDEVLVNANQNADDYARLGQRVVPDAIGGFAGPLAGLHAGLTAASHELAIIYHDSVASYSDANVNECIQTIASGCAAQRRATRPQRPHFGALVRRKFLSFVAPASTTVRVAVIGSSDYSIPTGLAPARQPARRDRPGIPPPTRRPRLCVLLCTSRKETPVV